MLGILPASISQIAIFLFREEREVLFGEARRSGQTSGASRPHLFIPYPSAVSPHGVVSVYRLGCSCLRSVAGPTMASRQRCFIVCKAHGLQLSRGNCYLGNAAKVASSKNCTTSEQWHVESCEGGELFYIRPVETKSRSLSITKRDGQRIPAVLPYPSSSMDVEPCWRILRSPCSLSGGDGYIISSIKSCLRLNLTCDRNGNIYLKPDEGKNPNPFTAAWETWHFYTIGDVNPTFHSILPCRPFISGELCLYCKPYKPARELGGEVRALREDDMSRLQDKNELLAKTNEDLVIENSALEQKAADLALRNDGLTDRLSQSETQISQLAARSADLQTQIVNTKTSLMNEFGTTLAAHISEVKTELRVEFDVALAAQVAALRSEHAAEVESLRATIQSLEEKTGLHNAVQKLEHITSLMISKNGVMNVSLGGTAAAASHHEAFRIHTPNLPSDDGGPKTPGSSWTALELTLGQNGVVAPARPRSLADEEEGADVVGYEATAAAAEDGLPSAIGIADAEQLPLCLESVDELPLCVVELDGAVEDNADAGVASGPGEQIEEPVTPEVEHAGEAEEVTGAATINASNNEKDKDGDEREPTARRELALLPGELEQETGADGADATNSVSDSGESDNSLVYVETPEYYVFHPHTSRLVELTNLQKPVLLAEMNDIIAKIGSAAGPCTGAGDWESIAQFQPPKQVVWTGAQHNRVQTVTFDFSGGRPRDSRFRCSVVLREETDLQAFRTAMGTDRKVRVDVTPFFRTGMASMFQQQQPSGQLGGYSLMPDSADTRDLNDTLVRKFAHPTAKKCVPGSDPVQFYWEAGVSKTRDGTDAMDAALKILRAGLAQSDSVTRADFIGNFYESLWQRKRNDGGACDEEDPFRHRNQTVVLRVDDVGVAPCLQNVSAVLYELKPFQIV